MAFSGLTARRPALAKHISNTGRQRKTTFDRRQNPDSGNSVYKRVTDSIVEALEKGVVPWRKPWNVSTAIPCNAVSKRPYHGINLLLLGLSKFQDHRWLTFRQARELGGTVNQGETSSIAVFWKQLEARPEDTQEGRPRAKSFPLLRFYHLFNAQQCEGVRLPELEVVDKSQVERIEAAEEFVLRIPSPPRLHEGHKFACYYPQLDMVQVPPLHSFVTPDAYYGVLFHELAHATGHKSRLNRQGVTEMPRFGSMNYSREELVAELTSSFCCASLGLDNSLIENSASYIDGWLKCLKEDSRAIISASAKAQKAANYLRGEPAKDVNALPSDDLVPEEVVA